MKRLSLSMIKKAHQTFRGWFPSTPIEYSPYLSSLLKMPVLLKHEFLQPCGSYQLRGFFYYLSTLKQEEKERGVALADPHNGSIALAYAAHLLKIPCTIFYKEIPSKILKKKCEAYQAELIPQSQSLQYLEQTKRVLLTHNDPRILAGCGGGLAIELLKDIPQLKNVIVPIGQGDLLGGLLFFLKKKFPDSVIIGCQLDPSILNMPSYLHHELTTSLSPLSKNLIDKYLSQQVLITEKNLMKAANWLLQEHQIIVEPSAAIATACCLFSNVDLLEGPTAVIITGRSFSEDDIKNPFNQ